MENQNRFSFIKTHRKVFILSGLVLAIIALILISALTPKHSAKITIITNGNNNIVITKQGVNAQNAFGSSGSGKLVVILSPGEYTVTVSNQQLSSQRLISVLGGKNQTITINLGQLGVLDPVTNQTTHFLSATDNTLVFLNQNAQLEYIDNQNNEHVIDNSNNLQVIKWGSSGYGIGQDQSGNLYLISDNTVSPINLSATKLNLSKTLNNFAVAPDKTLYVSDGQSVYAGTIGSTLRVLYRTNNNSHIDLSSASNNGVLGDISSNNLGSGKVSTEIMVITPKGNTYQVLGDLYSSAWSQSGKYVVTTSDEATTIYDSKLNEVAVLPANNINAPEWLNDNELFYGIAGQLWEYSLQSKSANQVADISNFGYVSELNIDEGDTYLYVVVQNTQSTQASFQLVRFGLNGQVSQNVMQQLQVALPNTINGCLIGYINYTKPTVTAPGLGTNGQSCTQVAATYLSQEAINASLLTIAN